MNEGPSLSTSERWSVFLCYRQVDGLATAEWLYEHLNGRELPTGEENAPHLEVYFDQTAPAAPNWKELHQPALEKARALIVVCTPGARNVSGPEDFVHMEIHWWMKNREAAPILVDATGEGDRWVPEPIRRRWPYAQRLDFAAAVSSTDRKAAEHRIVQRIAHGIHLSESRVRDEELDRRRRWQRQLACALVLSVLTSAVAAWKSCESTANLNAAERARAEARREAGRSLREQGRLELVEGSSSKALVLLSHALSKVPDDALTRFLIARARVTLDRCLRTINGQGQVTAFSADLGRVLMWAAHSDETLRILESSTGHVLATLDDDVKPEWRATAFSPDGTKVVTAVSEGSRIFDAKTGRGLVTLKGHETVVAAAFNKDGSRVVTANWDGTVRVFDAKSGARLADLTGHTEPVSRVAFSEDGTRVVTASWDRTARVFDATTGQLQVTLDHEKHVDSAAFSPDGTKVLTASWDKTARIFGAVTGDVLVKFEGHEERVRAAAFSPDGARVVTADDDTSAQVFDAATGRKLATLEGHEATVLSAVFSQDGNQVATTCADGVARVFQVNAEQVTIERTVARLSPDGTKLAGVSEVDNRGRVFDVMTGNVLSILGEQPQEAHSWTTFSPDGTKVLTTRPPLLFDVATGQSTSAFGQPFKTPTDSAAFSPDGNQVVLGSSGTARLFDAATGRELRDMQTGNHHGFGRTSVSFSPDGTRVVMVGPGGVGVFDAATGGSVAAIEIKEHVLWRLWNNVRSVHPTPDGSRVARAMPRDRTARLFDTSTGAEVVLEGFEHTPSQPFVAAFSPAVTRVVAASGTTARMFSAPTGRVMATLKGHEGSVSSVAFSQDGAYIVTASQDRTVHVSDATSGRVLAVLRMAGSALSSDLLVQGFSHDRTRIVVSDPWSTHIWDVTPYAGTPEELEKYVRTKVPYRLSEQGVVVPHSLLDRSE